VKSRAHVLRKRRRRGLILQQRRKQWLPPSQLRKPAATSLTGTGWNRRLLARRSAENPANLDEIVGFAPLSTREETREAVAAARAAFPAWRDTPAPVRARILAKARC